MLVAEPVLGVRKSGRGVLQKCTGYLEKKFVWMFWEDVGEDCFGGDWLAILEMCLINLFLVARFMFIVIFFDEKK